MKCAHRAVPRRVCALLVTAAVATGGPAVATADESVPESAACPGFIVLGVQGTGQSSQDSAPSVDSGLLASVLRPLTEVGDGRMAGRAYVPYSASFGGAMPGTTETYSASATEGLDRLREMAGETAARCPRSQLGLIGYSQGAHVVSMFAREVGRGAAVVPAERVAAVALLADPTRSPGAPVFPGLPGRGRPDPAPGTTGAELDSVPSFAPVPLSGGGIGPLRDITADFGALTGRVASLCLSGDLACDAPAGAPLLHMVVNILGQAELLPSDPVGALNSISDAVSDTAARAAITIVNQDLGGYSLGTLSLTSEKPLSVRLAEAADPRVGAEPDARAAVLKLGTSALNTLLAILGVALTPDEVDAVTTATDPLTGLEQAVTALVAASKRPLPRRTAFNLLTKTFDALGYLGVDNAALLDPSVWLRYTDTVRRHGDYANAGFVPDGQSATGLVLNWFSAVAEDIAVHRVPPPPAPVDQPPATGVPRPAEPPPAPGVPAEAQPENAGLPAAVDPVAPRFAGRADRVVETASSRPISGLSAYLLGLALLAAFTICSCTAGYFGNRLRRVPVSRRRATLAPRWPSRPRADLAARPGVESEERETAG